ncbi:hypothetical protein DRJ25_05560 [Candidatus Woesearchaeota archaeon]|nr:MAG: hypothetical protein DRJ25_05560 [Candidatus Woesearchaeota archaeon]
MIDNNNTTKKEEKNMGNDEKILAVTKAASHISTLVEKSELQAEMALSDIASENGDEFALEVLKQMPPLQIAKIIRSRDFSCPSIISPLATPELVVEFFRKEPLLWEMENEKTFQSYDGNIILNLISMIIIGQEDDGKRAEILEAVAEDEISFEYLMQPFIGWEARAETDFLLENTEIEFGSADHLFEVILKTAPRVAQKILKNIGRYNPIWSKDDLYQKTKESIEEKEKPADSVEDDGFIPLD